MTVDVVAPDEVEAEESTPGVVRKTVFETGTAVMVQSQIAGGTTSGWHHHGGRHVYGYVVKGTGTLEYGPRGDQRQECGAGEYFYISPETVHRDVNPTDEEIVVLVCFVGSGPIVVNVDDPTDG
jgi:quercetin dioxygenase-like cupin family protein